MPETTRLYPPLPLRGVLLVVLCALFLLPGLAAHDPWKGDDAVSIGVIYSLITEGDWLVPHLAGESYFDNPPLYYWVGAVLAKLFGSVLPLHDAARLASAVFVGLMLLFLALVARRLHGQDSGRIAPLVGIGCIGLFAHSHDAQPLNALLAAAMACYFGLVLMRDRPLAGGLTAGAAIGLGFLACGLVAPLSLVPLLLLLPLASVHWRNRNWALGAAIALVVALLLGGTWPLVLARSSENLLWNWWYRELADFRLSPDWPKSLGIYLSTLSWFAWPAWPLAGWALWRARRDLAQPGIALPLLAFAVALLAQTILLSERNLNALPLLPPLMLLAVPAAGTLRRGAANALDWFGMMTFTFFVSLVWLGWVAMVFGVPARLARKVAKLEPGFVAELSWTALAAALLLTAGWIAMIIRTPRSPYRAVTHWAAGITLLWCLLAALWLPLIDYSRSYRGVANSLARALPNDFGCIAGRGLGDPQRASFHYFAGIVTRAYDSAGARKCRYTLVQGTARATSAPASKGWRKIWEGNRPGDKTERYRLYRKE